MSVFRFKQFEIEQSDHVFKVGTDGLLLATWAKINKAKNILDIGCGTGLVALVCAQRNKTAKITAIDNNPNAINLAIKNSQNSPWKQRIKVIQSDIVRFESNSLFDHILSNPPFFSNSTKSPYEVKNTAKHNDSLTPDNLFSAVSRLLHPEGIFSLIYPTRYRNEWVQKAENNGLFVREILQLHGRKELPAKRILVSFTREKSTPKLNSLTLETTRGTYTPEATALLRDFLLKL